MRSPFLSCFALLTVAGVAACGSAPLDPPEQPRQVVVVPEPTASPGVARLLGEWSAQPPASEARLLDMARAALSPDVTDEDLATLGFTPEEEKKVRAVRRLRERDPSSPLVLEMKKKLATIDAIRVTFTPEKLISTSDASTSVEHYVIEEDLGERVLLLVDGEKPIDKRRYMVRFVDADHIVIQIGETTVPFARVGARVTAAAQADARPSGRLDFDACVRTYLRRMEECMARLPPSAQAATREALELTKRAIRMSSETPDGRESFATTCNRMIEGPALDAFCSL